MPKSSRLYARMLSWMIMISISPLHITQTAHASGIATHLLVSEQAADLVADPTLRQLIQRYPDALSSATSFPDGGYPLDYRWGEPAHWAPFQNAYLERVKSLCLGRYLSHKYCGKLAIHLLGSVGHGFQDQVTDALLLPKIAEQDGTDSTADQDIDFFVIADYPNRQAAIPQTWFIPFFELYYSFQDLGLGRVSWLELLIGGGLIRAGMIGEFAIFPFGYAEGVHNIPWARDNYISYPGGINQMTVTTARLYDYLWDRLNEVETQEYPVLMPFPAPGSLVPHANIRTDSQMGIIADRGIIPNTVNNTSFVVTSEQGHSVSGRFSMRTSMASPVAESHLIIFYPNHPLEPNTTYTVSVSASVRDEQGNPLVPPEGLQWQFQTF
ncbi:MAG: Ig-like domain-containing protein [Pseudomonadales bacterium]|nr:Ig-like domain-containing protein [Pseudomonadales bacterium]